MADQSRDNLNPLRTELRASRWRPKAIAFLAVLGGVYGAALGAAISTTAQAIYVIAIPAALGAVILGLNGARFGSLLVMVHRNRFARWVVGLIAATGGAILGGFLGLLAVMPLGAILGAMGGSVFIWVILRRGFFRRLGGSVLGLVLGACVGAIVLALRRDPVGALVGIAWGTAMGAVVAPLPLLGFVRMLDSLTRQPHARRTTIDAIAVDLPEDQD